MKPYTALFSPAARLFYAIFVGMTLLASLAGGAGCAQKNECSMDVDCGWGTFCREGQCIAECQFDDDCDYPGMVCVRHRGYCRYPDAGVGDDSGTPNDAAVPDAAMPDAATDGSIWQLDAATQQDGTVVTPDGSTPTDGIYTDPCTSGGGCTSGFCFEDLRANTDFCSGTCVSDSSCILTHECASVSSQNLCQASDVGKECDGPNQCNNSCIGNAQTGVGHCTAMCNSAADCPAGFACTSLSGTKYCVNISMTCTGPMDCLTGVCLSDFGFYACTATCVSSNDCPIGYICDTDGYGNWYCVPPTAGTGGLGSNCDGSTYTCQSGLCLGNYCTHECGVTHGVGQWCPPRVRLQHRPRRHREHDGVRCSRDEGLWTALRHLQRVQPGRLP